MARGPQMDDQVQGSAQSGSERFCSACSYVNLVSGSGSGSDESRGLVLSVFMFVGHGDNNHPSEFTGQNLRDLRDVIGPPVAMETPGAAEEESSDPGLSRASRPVPVRT